MVAATSEAASLFDEIQYLLTIVRGQQVLYKIGEYSHKDRLVI